MKHLGGKGTMYKVIYRCEWCDQDDVWRCYSYNPRQFCCSCGKQMSVKVEALR